MGTEFRCCIVIALKAGLDAAMPRLSAHLKLDSFNFRVDGDLKRAFLEVAAREDRPAGSILRDFMRSYVAQKQAGFRASTSAPSDTALAQETKAKASSTRRGRK
ncbi:hypothetical protein Asru_0238_08 [Acidisphaera rubrifaciens HS-AP3]|uniref:Uncharacterized protein n=1 Tax=Acidisphaera rubrifaciens HS-AP3 TaxID=1231350 RepID=A0A0D6P632_9PROT|nr:hypothetical protein Asru_0238_08 [Acidisphaera rubrifaciens HS-AP3]